MLIPWDKDTSLNAPEFALYYNIDGNVLAKKLLADPAKKQVYVDAVKKAVANFVNSAYLGARFESLYTVIHEAALADTKKPQSNNEFEVASAGLRGIIASRGADVARQAP